MSKSEIVFVVSILVLSTILRIRPIFQNHPFWVDEYSSAIQALTYEDVLTRHNTLNTVYIEKNNYLSHALIFLSMHLFGVSVQSARLPFLIIGSFIPIAIYLFCKKLFDNNTGIIAALFASTSYFMITWSTQARGYVIQQLLLLVILLLYRRFKDNKSIYNLSALILTGILGLLVHNIFIIPIFSLLFIYLVESVIGRSQHMLKVVVFIIVVFAVVIAISSAKGVLTNDLFRFHNNVWYYHSLLWRQYGLLIFLAIIGAVRAISKRTSMSIVLLLIALLHLSFFTFFFGHYIAKYVLIIFPIILIFASNGIILISERIKDYLDIQKVSKKQLIVIFSVIMTLLIIVNGDKFVLRPKSYYSVNHDMRDIAIIDYNSVYQIIKNRLNSNPDIAIIDTWPDRSMWYLGRDINIFQFRWENSGLRKTTIYSTNKNGDKIIKDTNIVLVSNISDFIKIKSRYNMGYIFIDDDSLPEEVVNYARLNLKKEIFINSYEPELKENPYSIWPATLYSWGFEDPE